MVSKRMYLQALPYTDIPGTICVVICVATVIECNHPRSYMKMGKTPVFVLFIDWDINLQYRQKWIYIREHEYGKKIDAYNMVSV